MPRCSVLSGAFALRKRPKAAGRCFYCCKCRLILLPRRFEYEYEEEVRVRWILVGNAIAHEKTGPELTPTAKLDPRFFQPFGARDRRPSRSFPLNNPPTPNGPDGRLCAIGDADLAEDILDMLLDGFDADAQRAADFLIAQAQGDVPQHLCLAIG